MGITEDLILGKYLALMVKSENAPYLKFGDESLGGSSPSGSTKLRDITE